jgi:hypothetical protein
MRPFGVSPPKMRQCDATRDVTNRKVSPYPTYVRNVQGVSGRWDSNPRYKYKDSLGTEIKWLLK